MLPDVAFEAFELRTRSAPHSFGELFRLAKFFRLSLSSAVSHRNLADEENTDNDRSRFRSTKAIRFMETIRDFLRRGSGNCGEEREERQKKNIYSCL